MLIIEHTQPGKLLMLRRITSILLFVVLTGGSEITAKAFCAQSSMQRAEGAFQRRCEMAQTMMATLASCCQRALVSHHEQAHKESSSCCQMSTPLPDQPNTALPGSSSDDFRLQTQSQLLDSSQPISPLALTPFLPSWVSTIEFCPDRSDIYLMASTFRI
jgi:hypothetical protein